MDGLEFIHKLHQVDDSTCIIMLTGYGSIATALAATKLGASHYSANRWMRTRFWMLIRIL